MKKLLLPLILLASFITSCEDDDIEKTIVQGDYPVKEYYLERSPSINVWGAGMDFVHSECKSTETNLDYEYMEEVDDFPYDIDFYVVKSYYYDENGDLQNEGCPAMLLSSSTQGCKIGEGLEFFTNLTTITSDMIDQLAYDPVIDYSDYKDEETGFYEREGLFAAIDKCVIGRDFRSGVLEIPDGMTEEEVQPVYLIKTSEGAYVKFMVRTYKPAKPNEKQTIVHWQVISE